MLTTGNARRVDFTNYILSVQRSCFSFSFLFDLSHSKTVLHQPPPHLQLSPLLQAKIPKSVIFLVLTSTLDSVSVDAFPFLCMPPDDHLKSLTHWAAPHSPNTPLAGTTTDMPGESPALQGPHALPYTMVHPLPSFSPLLVS